jgi:hypothetical protein
VSLVYVRVATRSTPCCICRFRIQVGQNMIRWRGAYAHTVCVVRVAPRPAQPRPA